CCCSGPGGAAMPSTLRWSVGTFLASAVVLVVALEYGHGAPAPVPVGIPDPGALTGWGLPATKVVADLCGIVTVGLLVTAVFLLPGSGEETQGLSARAVRGARWFALAWVLATAALYVFTVSDIFAEPVGGLSWPLFSELTTRSSLGRALVAQMLIALAVALSARWVLSVRTVALLVGLALGGFVPQALTGHSAASGAHDLAIVSLLVHLAAAALWVGGLAGLGWVSLRGSKRLPAGVTRFSTLAAWCVGMLAASGVANAVIRVGSVDALLTPYAALVGGKALGLLVLGALGWQHRRRTVPRLQTALDDAADEDAPRLARRAFARLAAVELTIMAMTVALAVALSRTPTPVPDDLYEGRAAELLGIPMPPPPDFGRLVIGWNPSGAGLLVVTLGVALYAQGIWIMHRRGDRWPVGRTVAWAVGLLIVAWATFGGLGRYSNVLFSAHMVSHMMLSMIAPIFLVLGAPVTLALRTLPGPRQRGDLGPRQLLIAFLHSRFVRVLTHPVLAAVLFVGSLYALYFTNLFAFLMLNHPGHAVMELHFLFVGSLYYYVLVGVDPSPRRLQPLVRFGVLMVTIPFHAFFSIAVMSASTVMGSAYWSQLDRPYRTDLLADQYLGGGVAWAMGEIPLILVLGALFVQWIRSDRREATRFDRGEQGSADSELAAYNAYLASLRERDRS
ncbi:MAG: cytochrome c oxidase assembly protein, partial [Nocardioidaceae bacterium]